MAAPGIVLVMTAQAPGVDRLRALLLGDGYQLTVAEDVAAAKAALRARPPELILLDAALPDAGARALLTWMRNRSGGVARAPIWLLIDPDDGRHDVLAAYVDGRLALKLPDWMLLAQIGGIVRDVRVSPPVPTPGSMAPPLPEAADAADSEVRTETPPAVAAGADDDTDTAASRIALRLESTFEHMSDAFMLLDRNWRFVFLNSAAAKVLRRERESLYGRSIWEEIPAARQTRFQAEYQRAMDRSEAVHFEARYDPSGDWFDVDAYPGPAGLAVYFRVITERKRQEQALRESEQRLQLITQASEDAIWDWDLIEDSIWWSESFQTGFGYAPDAVPTSSLEWLGRIHPDDRDRVLGVVHHAIETGVDRWSAQYRFSHQSGHYVEVLDRGLALRNATGRPVRMVGTFADISHRLAMEEQLRLLQRLESIGRLTGGIAHDFNNLLTVILGNAEVLLAELTDTGDHRKLVEMIASAAERGAALTSRLLAFARKQALDPRAVDLDGLIGGMVPLLERTLGEDIELELKPGTQLWTAMIDPGQLEDALLNLSLNARDAMPTGGHLLIETSNVRLDHDYAQRHSYVTPGNYIQVAISDSGAGISLENLEHVFEPFFSTKDKDKGTGLGLSMVYGFIKQSGGHIHIYSELGMGTTVKMYLPPAGDAVGMPDMAPATALADGGSETILLVEDDELVRHHARAQLLALGYRVLEAENGLRALELFESHAEIDLLFTDVVMPGGMSGGDLAERVRERAPDMRVLFTSGYTENAIVHQGRIERGMRLLSKPYRREELARAIREALD